MCAGALGQDVPARVAAFAGTMVSGPAGDRPALGWHEIGGGTMAPPPEDSSGTPDDYKSFADTVRVDVTDLVSYWNELTNDLAPTAMSAASTAMSEMNMLIFQGLNTPLEGEILPEGQQFARFLQHRVSDFQHFFKDVTDGLVNIGSAAAVIAEIYKNSDNANAADLNDIDFVFGDATATPPSGFANRETMDEYNERMAEAQGTDAMSLTGDDSFATNTVSYPYGTIYTFADGSQKHVSWSTQAGPDGQLVNVTTTTYYGTDGRTVVSAKTDRSYETSGGQPVRSTTTTTGQGDTRRQTTSTTTENSNGSITVRNETQVGDGKPQTSETTVYRDSHRDGEVDAPVEDASDKLDSDGGQQTVEQYGMVR
jgi:hypothetical protein